MSILTLVRHGQAAPFQRESAELTSLGEAQAFRLAHYWIERGVQFDEVYTGSLRRQVQTEEVVGATILEAGLPWPSVRVDPAWNEYDVPGLLGPSPPSDARQLQRLFEAAMLEWLNGPGWEAFRARLGGAIARLLASPPGRRVAIFTSGGPIGFAVHHAMKAPPRGFLEVHWRVRNASVTEFRFDRDRFTLDSFNATAHLDPSALTYR